MSPSIALLWLGYQFKRGIQGAVVFDIDDALIDGNETVHHGFNFMVELYDTVFQWFPVHVVTARPDDQHAVVMEMLKERGLCIPPDRLHMLPQELYGLSTRHVEEFKWKVHERLVAQHKFVVGRFDDKLWDVATLASLDPATTSGMCKTRTATSSSTRLQGYVVGKIAGNGVRKKNIRGVQQQRTHE